MFEGCSIKKVPIAKIALAMAAVLIAGSVGGCATLMQAFSAQPTAAVFGSENPTISSQESADAAAASADSHWTTHVYHGWAGPSSQM